MGAIVPRASNQVAGHGAGTGAHDRAGPHLPVGVNGVIERRQPGPDADTESASGAHRGPDRPALAVGVHGRHRTHRQTGAAAINAAGHVRLTRTSRRSGLDRRVSGAGAPAGGTVSRYSYRAPTSSGVIWANASQGIGEPANLRPPFLNRAMNVARSGNFMSALPASGVMFGGRNLIAGVHVREEGGIERIPTGVTQGRWRHPSARCTACGSRHSPTTESARYSPRAAVICCGGEIRGGWTSRRGLAAGTNRLHDLAQQRPFVAAHVAPHRRQRAQVGQDRHDVARRSCPRTASAGGSTRGRSGARRGAACGQSAGPNSGRGPFDGSGVRFFGVEGAQRSQRKRQIRRPAPAGPCWRERTLVLRDAAGVAFGAVGGARDQVLAVGDAASAMRAGSAGALRPTAGSSSATRRAPAAAAAGAAARSSQHAEESSEHHTEDASHPSRLSRVNAPAVSDDFTPRDRMHS